ncbi:DUF6510 family protein [Streptomyces sp. NPDC001422]|uniref:DUF6510 family protein n=1 Tax=Streptomyces sp. NPDC001422 TaxID=3364575 RepID=UPI003698419C
MTTLPLDAPYDAYDDDAHEDGNVLAGPLSEVFAVDLTVAVATCTGCGSAGPVARLRVYGRGPGLIARCPDCAHVVLRLVRGPGTAWLDLRGTVSLRIALPDPLPDA